MEVWALADYAFQPNIAALWHRQPSREQVAAVHPGMIIHLEEGVSVEAFGGRGHSVLLPWDGPHPNFRVREGGLNLVGEFLQVLHPSNGPEF